MYSSFVPPSLRPLYRFYLRGFVRRRLKFDPETHFAVGLISTGIFGNEPLYKNPAEMDKDILFLKKQGVKNIVVFHLGAIHERKNPDAWIDVLKKHI